MSGFGSALLYRAATGLEAAMADADAERLIAIDAELIIDNWDAYAVASRNLPYLAFAMGVTLWEDDYWSEGVKRQWVADQWQFKALRGTIAGIRMALAASGYELVDYVGPPQGFYASADLTPAQWNSWIHLMPELRIYHAPRSGTRGLDEFFCDWGCADQDAVPIDDGWVLRGRYAVLRHLGVDTPLEMVHYAPGLVDAASVDYERVAIPGKSTLGIISDADFAGDERFVCFEEVTPRLITVRLDRQYSVDASQVSLTTIVPSETPLTPRFETDSDVGNGGVMVFAGDNSDDHFADRPDGGGLLLADRMYLLDPSVAAPMTDGMSFVDVDRVGMPVQTIELLVDLKTAEPMPAVFVDSQFADEGFACPEDPSHIDRALRAINAGKALRDTALVSFAPRRPLELGDIVTTATRSDAWVRAML